MKISSRTRRFCMCVIPPIVDLFALLILRIPRASALITSLQTRICSRIVCEQRSAMLPILNVHDRFVLSAGKYNPPKCKVNLKKTPYSNSLLPPRPS